MASADSQPDGRDTLVAFSLLVLGAMAVALMPNLGKLALNDGANAETIVLIRCLTAMPLLAAYMLVRGIKIKIPSQLFLLMLVASLSSAGMNYTFLYAIQYIDISQTILIVFTHPFLIAYFYHVNGQSPMSLFRVFWSLTAFFGLALALAVDFSTISLTGATLAAASSLFASALVVSIVKVSNATNGVTTNFHLTFWMFILTILILATVGSLQWPETSTGWISGTGNGLCFIVAYLTFLGAARLIGASRASILTFMEPLATILLASYLFGEYLTPLQWGGVALVAAGLLFMEIPRNFWTNLRQRQSDRA